METLENKEIKRSIPGITAELEALGLEVVLKKWNNYQPTDKARKKEIKILSKRSIVSYLESGHFENKKEYVDLDKNDECFKLKPWDYIAIGNRTENRRLGVSFILTPELYQKIGNGSDIYIDRDIYVIRGSKYVIGLSELVFRKNNCPATLARFPKQMQRVLDEFKKSNQDDLLDKICRKTYDDLVAHTNYLFDLNCFIDMLK